MADALRLSTEQHEVLSWKVWLLEPTVTDEVAPEASVGS